ncbi:MAG: NAD(P)H-hydrate dehydratase [Candidatus Margulisbacteria bacterium]|nr:NAD(P)H-hydrate dehydratase [Candidatus Margulisiibacteriota bacterium]MBU1022556.1 NAD(P)H-hydrate dehydratase [Candidatus Margulisiibacteriota bacterium]MBU1728842.1 NAD(P)H-hydrate dehydratase [Candidatus Margulisiibacteriota bacterium]MBU1955473.1 NAD(P)H-hydrate dehydratase [Candidatus Margulisiibacteriota bacterium]
MENLVVTKEEAKRLDSFTINKLGIPAAVLMENAGRSSTFEILNRYPWITSAAILVYKGNNGGDGLVIARYLHEAGKAVKVVLLADPKNFSGDALKNYKIAENLKIPMIKCVSGSTARIKFLLNKSDLIVDAIFGVGLSSKITGFLAKVINEVNKVTQPIKVAVDVPSGIDADTGKVLGTACKVDLTATMAFIKKGLLEPEARSYVGRVVVINIGIPTSILIKQPKKGKSSPAKISEKGIDIITSAFASNVLKIRKYDSNKGDFGRVLIVGGSRGMSGAVILAASSALKSGAGLVYAAVPKGISNIVESACIEPITLPLPESKEGSFCFDSIDPLAHKLNKIDAILIGPGMAASLEAKEFFFEFLSLLVKEKSKIPVIIDADGLNCLSENIEVLSKVTFPVVLTPHPGEFGRLIKSTIPTVKEKRIALSELFAERFKINLVLKGAYTLCTKGKKKTSINFTGNPGMASAGMGDVLSGLLASLIGQGIDPFSASKAAVFIHGLAGDVLERQIGVHGLIATSVVDTLPLVIKSLYRG